MKLSELIFESDEDILAKELSKEFEEELEDGKVDEAIISTATAILGWALTSNSIIDILGKYIGKALEKSGLDKAANKAKAAHEWAHRNEAKIVGRIDRSLKKTIKDDSKRSIVSKGIFIVLLLGLGIKAGISGFKALKAAKVSTATLATVKAALKGRDVATVGKEIARAAV